MKQQHAYPYINSDNLQPFNTEQKLVRKKVTTPTEHFKFSEGLIISHTERTKFRKMTYNLGVSEQCLGNTDTRDENSVQYPQASK